MTLSAAGRRVAKRPAFPSYPAMHDGDELCSEVIGKPGMTIHEHAMLEHHVRLLAAFVTADPEGGRDETLNVVDELALEAADRYCNALGVQEGA